ncbi:hypothetical protein ACWC09_27845 [Streptomyces sp. NPDC001617]
MGGSAPRTDRGPRAAGAGAAGHADRAGCVGTTRLAARIAARVERGFPDGVRLVQPAGRHDPALVPIADADALDNCEHLLPACAALGAARRGASERAAVLLDGADRVWADVDRGRWGSQALGATGRVSETRARRAVGEAAFERAYARGGALGLVETVGYAVDDAPHEQPSPRRESSRAPGIRPTRRESEAAQLVAQGPANQQITDRLVIAPPELNPGAEADLTPCHGGEP